MAGETNSGNEQTSNAGTGQTPTGQSEQASQSQNNSNQTQQSNNKEPNSNPLSAISLDEALKLITDLRKENSDNRKKVKAQEEAQERAEQERLKQAGEWQKLAETKEERLKQLEPVAEGYSRLSSMMASQIEAGIKEWPAEVKAFDPGKDAPIEARLDWFEKSKPLVSKLTAATTGTGHRPGNGPGPRQAGEVGQETANKTVQELRNTGRYAF